LNKGTFVLCRTKQAALGLYVIEGDHDLVRAITSKAIAYRQHILKSREATHDQALSLSLRIGRILLMLVAGGSERAPRPGYRNV